MGHHSMNDYLAHGFCFSWDPALVWLHVISDIATGIAYYSIPVALFYFVYKRRDMPFLRMFVLFGIFILSCGTTHLLAAYTVFKPIYWHEGVVKAITAFVSIGSAILFIPLIPKAIALPSLTKALEAIKILNKTLEKQVEELRIKDSAIASSVNAIVFTDLNGRLIYINHAFLELWGYDSKEEVLGKTVSVFWESEEHASGLIEALRNNRNWAGELTARRNDGKLFPGELTWNTVQSESGNPICFMGLFTDITERKKAEDELRKSKDTYKDLFDSTVDGIYQVDADGVFMLMNLAGARIFGYESPDEIIGRNALEYWRKPEDRDVFRSELEIKKSVSAYPIRARKKNGEPIELETSSRITEDEKGNFLGVKGMLRDVTERKRSEEQIQRHIQRLSALRAIDMAISSTLDIRVTLNIFIQHAITQLGVDAANVLLLNPNSKILEYATGQGFQTNALKHTHLYIGEGCAGIAALENRIVRISNLKELDNTFKQSALIKGEDFISYYGVPLVARGHVRGVMEIFSRSLLEPDEEWFEFLASLALQAAIAIDNSSLFFALEQSNTKLSLAYDSTIEGWSRALDYRDKETEGHSQRVTEMTVRLAREMGMSEEELLHVRRGALLHDIGKMGVPDNILLKSDRLTDEEWKIIRFHPIYAHELLYPIAYLRPSIDIPYCHHEKWDGTGYPRGLKGEEIPFSARIFAIVDVWDALCSDRPYRPTWTEETAKEYLRSNSGTHFDPKVVETFIRLIV